MATAFPQIPYGWADFEAMRVEHCLYVDKTRFLRELEHERYAFLIRPRLFRLTGDMAYEGAWRPVVEYLSGAVARQTAIRDYIDGEKVVQTFFAAYLGLTDHFVLHSEPELNNGYADLHLEPFTPRHQDMGYGYLIEFKYLKRGERLEPARAANAGRHALDQLRGYLADGRLRRHPSVRHIGLALVFHGWELVWSEAVALP